MTTPLGTVTADDQGATIAFERRYPHPIEAVWAALTEPEQLASWLGVTVLEGCEGGTIVIEAGPQSLPVEVRRTTGRILAWDPPRVLEYEWHQAIIEASTVRFELTADGDATVLKLIHRWLSPRNANGFIPGWHAYLDRLAAHLAGDEIPDWSERYEQLKGGYSQAW